MDTSEESLPGTVPFRAATGTTDRSGDSRSGVTTMAIANERAAAGAFDTALGEVIDDDAVLSTDGGAAPNASRPPYFVSTGGLDIAALRSHEEAYAAGRHTSFIYSPHLEGVSALRPSTRSPVANNPTLPFPAAQQPSSGTYDGPTSPLRARAVSFHTVAMLHTVVVDPRSDAAPITTTSVHPIDDSAAMQMVDYDDDDTAVIDDDASAHRRYYRSVSFRSMDSDRDSEASSVAIVRTERSRLMQESFAARQHMEALRRDLGASQVAAGSVAVPGGFALQHSAPIHLLDDRDDERQLRLTQQSLAARLHADAPPASRPDGGHLSHSAYIVTTPPTPVRAGSSSQRPAEAVPGLADDEDSATADGVAQRALLAAATALANNRNGRRQSTVGDDSSSEPRHDAASSSADFTRESAPAATRYDPRTRRSRVMDLPTEVLRFAVDHFLSISQHFNLRLVCKRWNAMVTSNCVLWMRRVPNYLTHGYTSTTNCSVFINAGISVTATFNRIASRSSFGNFTVLSSTLSEDTLLMTRQQSFTSEVASSRFARPQAIHYCFNGCAYRTWRALKLQKALSCIRRFHKQKNKYFGGAAACGVLFPPSASYGTLCNAIVMCASFIVWATMWSDAVPAFMDPAVSIYTFVGLWVATFFFLCVLYMWSAATDNVRRLGLVLFGLSVAATVVMEFLLDAFPTVSNGALTFRVDSTSLSSVTEPPAPSSSNTTYTSTTTVPLVASSATLDFATAGSRAFAYLLAQTATRTNVKVADADPNPSHLLYLLPIVVASAVLAVASLFHARNDTLMASHALELFQILDQYCEGVVPVRRLPRRFRDGQPVAGIAPVAAAAAGAQPAPAPPAAAHAPPPAGAPRAAAAAAATGRDAAPPDNDSDDGRGGDGAGNSNADDAAPPARDGVSAVSGDVQKAETAHTQVDYSVTPFAIFNYTYTAIGACTLTFVIVFALETAGLTAYYTPRTVTISDFGGIASVGRSNGVGTLFASIPDPSRSAALNATASIQLVSHAASSSLALTQMRCAVLSGFRLSYVFAAAAMGLLLARHVVGIRSSWRKVGRRLPIFTLTMVLVGVAMLAILVASLGFAFTRVGLLSSDMTPAAVVAHVLVTVVSSAAPLAGATAAPGASGTSSSSQGSFQSASLRVFCRPPHALQTVELGFVATAVFVIAVSLCANLAHDKSKYYEFKMIKYRRYFERLCAGEDLTTLGIERLLVAIRRFSDAIGNHDASNATVTSKVANGRESTRLGAAR